MIAGGGSVSIVGEEGGAGGGVENERGGIGGGALDHVIAGMTCGFACAGCGAANDRGLSGGVAPDAPRAAVVAGGLGGPGLGGTGPPLSRIVLG